MYSGVPTSKRISVNMVFPVSRCARAFATPKSMILIACFPSCTEISSLIATVRACAGLVVFAPVMAAVAFAVLIDDGRPLFFRQQRVGFRRRPFSILKIRTMRDGRTTRVGRVLRVTGLDEVPQFVNIVAGEMSAVGPRPLTEIDVRRLGWSSVEFDFRWDVKPGLTGLAQLVGAPCTNDALELDRAYRARWSPLLDCRLIARSFAVNLLGKRRVQQDAARRRLATPRAAQFGRRAAASRVRGCAIPS
jgi:lipopolysaccharide/colanic/teichoic acid biosynthesis glycosyltransferase